MAVPDTTTFTLQDVVTEVNPTTDDLVDCFADATSASFDQAYKGNLDQLLNFRNYGAVTASGFATGTISVAGSAKIVDGTYSATQFSTSGSGSGATFNVTIVSKAVTSFTVTASGTGYAVSDTVTLQVSNLIPEFQEPRAELTVSTLG